MEPSGLTRAAFTLGLVAGVALLGVLSIAQVQVQTTVLAAPAQHITRTPSRVPEIPIYGMGYNDRLGIKPLCTHVTDKLGMVDCIPRSAAGLTGGSDWSEGLNLGNNIQSNVYNVGNNIQSSIYTPASTATTASTAAAGSYCQQTCIQCSNGMLAGPGCDNCLCGVSSDYYRDGTAPDNCNQVCYYCRTSMMSGYECDSCSCGHWPAPLTHDPLENSWY